MRWVSIIFKNKVIVEVFIIVKINDIEGQSQVKFALKAEVEQTSNSGLVKSTQSLISHVKTV